MSFKNEREKKVSENVKQIRELVEQISASGFDYKIDLQVQDEDGVIFTGFDDCSNWDSSWC